MRNKVKWTPARRAAHGRKLRAVLRRAKKRRELPAVRPNWTAPEQAAEQFVVSLHELVRVVVRQELRGLLGEGLR